MFEVLFVVAAIQSSLLSKVEEKAQTGRNFCCLIFFVAANAFLKVASHFCFVSGAQNNFIVCFSSTRQKMGTMQEMCPW